MLMNGRLYAGVFLDRVNQAIDKIDEAPIPNGFKISARVCFCSLPSIWASVFIPEIAPVFVLITLVLVYLVFDQIQDRLYELKPKERHWYICVPVHSLFLSWDGLLFWCENLDQIGRTVGAVVIVTAVALWPIYVSKKRYEEKRRTISFKTAYIIVSSMILLQQIFIIARSLVDA